jgi:hypothetical protein
MKLVMITNLLLSLDPNVVIAPRAAFPIEGSKRLTASLEIRFDLPGTASLGSEAIPRREGFARRVDAEVAHADAIGFRLLGDVLAGLGGVAPRAEALQNVLAAGAAIEERPFVIDLSLQAVLGLRCHIAALVA